jgi:hypothetical protein
MKTVSTVEMLLALAQSFRFVREEPRNSNRGQAIGAFLGSVGLEQGYAWCAAYVGYCGQFVPGWPLPLVAGCATLGEAAEKKGLLRPTPARGALFLLYYPALKRFAHTGICLVEKGGGVWRTIEGNTNGGGSRDGWGVFERERSFGPSDRFIHWWDAN